MTRHNNKRGFNLTRSSSATVAHKTRKGFNLIEAAIVLAVVGGVIGGIWVSAATMIENHKVNKTVEGVFMTARNIQNLISMSDSVAIGNIVEITNTIRDSGSYPKNFFYGNSVENIFGGAVYSHNYTSGEQPRFNITLEGIPASSCVKFVLKITSIGFAAGSKVPVGGSTWSDNRATLGHISVNTNANWNTATFPVSLGDAIAACNQTENRISTTFGYTRRNN